MQEALAPFEESVSRELDLRKVELTRELRLLPDGLTIGGGGQMTVAFGIVCGAILGVLPGLRS